MTINTVVLFGAGASYGSNDVFPHATPLGADLYTILKKNFPSTWGNLPHDIDTKFQDNFEEGMKLVWENHSHNVGLLMRHLTLYFAQFRQNNPSQNLYFRFIESIKQNANEIAMSSLNYDVLLELAITSSGLQVNYFSDSPIQNSMLVWKLHGSCNFIPVNIHAGSGVSYGSGVSFNSNIQAVSPNEAIQFCLSGTALYPAMCLYMDKKPTQISPSVIGKIQQNWLTSIGKANKVLIIGVRPNPNDTHIWNPIIETNAMVGYIGSNEDFIKYVKQKRENKDTKFIGRRWNEAFDDSITFVSQN
ncbi:MAG: hypothetical protein WAN47_08090 [Nitrosotalea sp.]